ncbi:stage III sporulation protein AF [Acetohalobium arabaticum]|uniref:Stage III sporulation protein AF n=1 Tax=Acetohalobium arabaticum (strain ATCC 49924 / DSM 5501 / Z-7288) TaxID=574087 RepID=D9QRW1_ACEAZ|nr:stage III sporulation protein AF [Acetohalobium arabaticum]ADL13252.1 stage III sporulation protein AF [Acetohalobium arabaticum DSM 5501]
MIAYLVAWIRNIVVILLLTSFIELLLPESELEKYTRVVLGLFIVIAILNPILNLFNNNYNFQQITDLLTVEEESQMNKSEIMEQGKELRNISQQKARSDYKRQLSKQIAALLSFNNELPKSSVKVKLRPDNKIEKIIIKLQQNENRDQPEIEQEIKVDDIEINNESQQESREANQKQSLEVNQQIKKQLANFYNLSHEQIIIKRD